MEDNIVMYRYRGMIERPSRKSFRWEEGYSEDVESGPLYPWMTRSECIADAKSRCCKARFLR